MNYPLVKQHNEEDCGAACIATISKYYGRTFSKLRRIKLVYNSGKKKIDKEINAN